MPAQRKTPLRAGEFDIDEDDDRVDVFQRGEIGRIIKTPLLELVSHYREGVDRERIEKFVKWLPEQNMEQFLMLCLDYGASKTMPKKTQTRRNRPARA